eukprot:EC825145.1.p1 GENE.EC825145.1~~EC825145.1.p1  ORF type:complete len:169 (+),score=34.09 EC825145.1:16-522(+)
MLTSILTVIFPTLIGGGSQLVTNYLHPNWLGYYNNLKKPKLNPPNSIFGPVWTVLYLFMGFSLLLISNNDKVDNFIKLITISIFILQLFLNFIWSIFFFGKKELLIAFYDILVLDLSVSVLLILLFKFFSLTSAMLIFPYLCWISFATYLNFMVYYLNRDVKENVKKN